MYNHRKIILVGDNKVGKTSIRRRYLRGDFKENYLMTLGVEFTIRRNDGNVIQIWDLSRQPGFKKVREAYYKGTTDIIFVYDLSRKETLKSYDNWMKEISENCSTNPRICIVGNKTDLMKEEELKRSREYVMSNLNHQLYFQISAKYSQNIDHLFDQVIAHNL